VHALDLHDTQTHIYTYKRYTAGLVTSAELTMRSHA
jgi:hypothetical protein